MRRIATTRCAVQLDQSGTGNVAHIAQNGTGLHALVEQYGIGSRVDLVQGPTAQNVMLRQEGERNVATLIQY